MRRNHIISVLFIIAGFLAGCAALKTSSSIPKRHEEELTIAPVCTECHEEDETIGNRYFSTYSHTADFFGRHGNLVGDFPAVCESCHTRKFCSDCHAVNEEITPSRKLGNRPDRSSPHRGDYLSKHKIEGRLKQSQCFKCHGRRNNKSCKQCH